jgi:hypothetical protein
VTGGRGMSARIGLAAVGALAVALTGCGGSKSGRVASDAARTAQGATLDFARCMRSHGVVSFPDPSSGGALPKSEVARLAAADPRFPAAHRACGHLLPNGGEPSPAQVEQAWNDMRDFARCMRSHGVPSWPDPAVTSQQDSRPFFHVPESVDPTAPRITARIGTCRHLLHADNPLTTTQ